MSIEDKLRDLFDEEGKRAVLPPDTYRRVAKRAAVRRALNAALATFAVVVVGLGFLGARELLTAPPSGPGGRAPLPSPTEPSLLPESEQKAKVFLEEYQVVLYYPQDWQRASDSLILTGIEGIEEKEIFSVGTYSLPPGSVDCDNLPERAMEALGPEDAFVTLQEIPPPSSSVFPARPDQFSEETGEITKEVGCLSNEEALTQGNGFRNFVFTERGRFFKAYVLLGELAPASTRQQAWDILNDFVVCDPASAQDDCS